MQWQEAHYVSEYFKNMHTVWLQTFIRIKRYRVHNLFLRKKSKRFQRRNAAQFPKESGNNSASLICDAI